MADEQRFPVYRLLGGHIACQLRPGDRWQVVDDALVDMLLEVFDGVTLQPGLVVQVLESPKETGAARELQWSAAP